MNVISQINFMLVIVIIIFAIAGLFGLLRGMVNSLSGIISLILSVILVSLLTPVITSVISDSTPVYEQVKQRCEKVLDDAASDILKDSGGSFQSLLPEGTQMDPSLVPSDLYGDVLNSLGKNDQTRLIQKLPVPDFVKDQMITYNNKEGYQKLKAETFKEFIVNYITSLIVNLLAFLITLLVVWLIIAIILGALRVFSHLPVLRFVDRLGGLIIGLVKGLVFVWLIFLVFTLLPGLDISKRAIEMIHESGFLEGLYNSNLFVHLVMGVVSRII